MKSQAHGGVLDLLPGHSMEYEWNKTEQSWKNEKWTCAFYQTVYDTKRAYCVSQQKGHL